MPLRAPFQAGRHVLLLQSRNWPDNGVGAIARILAANGKRVLIVDSDVESLGLHHSSPPRHPQTLAATRAWSTWCAASRTWPRDAPRESWHRWHRSLARVSDYEVAIRWPFPDAGALHYMSSGLQNRSYSSTVATLDWERFYERLGGGTTTPSSTPAPG